MRDLHPAEAQILRYFDYSHLPADLASVARRFEDLAYSMVRDVPSSPEVTAGLRKLLEAKDCFVRAALPVPSYDGFLSAPVRKAEDA
jgi:hypothetical protein